MATSGVITGVPTVGDLVNMACELVQVGSSAETLSHADAQLALRHLNWMLKAWQADGVNLWRISGITVNWLGATAEAALAANYLDFDNVSLRTSGIDRPLERYSHADYAAIPNKSQAGTPVAYSVVKTISTLRLRLWPVSASAITIVGDATRIVEDVTLLTQTLDLPQEWTETAAYNLAKRMLIVFPGVDPVTAKAIRDEADRSYARLKAFDRESGSTFMQPA